MSVIERYEVQFRDQTFGGTYIVGIQGEQVFHVTARCHNIIDAETVAAALNNQGAVKELERLKARLDLLEGSARAAHSATSDVMRQVAAIRSPVGGQ